MDTLKPSTAEQVREAVAWAAAGETPLEVLGNGSKRAFGRPAEASHRLDLGALSGILMYEPEELVMSARAATPMAAIVEALDGNRQRLAFEPPHLGPLLGIGGSGGTIGGAFACNLAGPRRPQAGAARDHILGFKAVNGRGEDFKSGGRVVKNVTGFDLSKFMAGSFGTLAVMTEVTFKVLPAPEETRTVILSGIAGDGAVAAMTRALGSPCEISGAAHLPADVAARSGVAAVAGAGQPVTAFRVEGPEPSVAARCRSLRGLAGDFGDVDELGVGDSAVLWREIRDVEYFAGEEGRQVWRLSVPPAEGARIAGRVLDRAGGRFFLDWGGGLLWLSMEPRPDAGHEALRGALGDTGGHATLLAAAAEVRARVPVFQPQPASLAALTRRAKEAFDPLRVLNRGRMYEGL